MPSARLILALTLLGGPAAVAAKASSPEEATLRWESWSDSVFERAKKEDRFVLLDLEAVWCHWCHVMDETTYRDPKVLALIRSRYIPVRVDQDARPDLSNRYEDYGWPATVVFDAEGREIVKFQGYIPPRRMESLLEAIIEDPSPGPSVALAPAEPARFSEQASLAPELRKDLARLLVDRYDFEHGGWGFVHKYLDWDSVEYSLALARAGDAEAERMARETLAAQRTHLLDPVWGGVYQYSDGGVWQNPHFEKIMSTQAENLRSYAQAYAQWRDPADLVAAQGIHRYLRTFLESPEGAFYTSQDADVVHGEHSGEYFALPDADRRKRGIPRVDTHVYARENGWVVHALAALYGATGEEAYLREAIRAASWIVEHRSLAEGGFRHDAADVAGPYLGDTLAAGRAFLSLYAATGDRAWLARAQDAATFISKRFLRRGVPGVATAATSGRRDRPSPQRDENVQAARFANLLFQYTGQPLYRQLADDALRYLATPEVAKRFNTGGVLIADLERRSDPLHITVVGHKDDAQALALLRAALAEPSGYKRVELWDKREGPLPRADVTYPELRKAAAFVCTDGRCSPPAYTPEELRAKVERLRASAVARLP